VSLKKAAVATVPLDDAGRLRTTQDAKLILDLRIDNRSPTKRYPFEPWGKATPDAGPQHLPTLTDNLDNPCRLLVLPVGTRLWGRKEYAAIEPGATAEATLVFEQPAADATYLDLRLPASAVGGSEEFRLRIPTPLVSRNRGK
jgi:hypothetical protein